MYKLQDYLFHYLTLFDNFHLISADQIQYQEDMIKQVCLYGNNRYNRSITLMSQYIYYYTNIYY